jgi:hypothetical protein
MFRHYLCIVGHRHSVGNVLAEKYETKNYKNVNIYRSYVVCILLIV